MQVQPPCPVSLPRETDRYRLGRIARRVSLARSTTVRKSTCSSKTHANPGMSLIGRRTSPTANSSPRLSTPISMASPKQPVYGDEPPQTRQLYRGFSDSLLPASRPSAGRFRDRFASVLDYTTTVLAGIEL